jgi:hypothetical protein
MSNIEQLPVKAPELKTGGTIKAVVPQSMDDAYRLAKAVCMSGLAPRGLDKPEAAMVAILHGLEIGLTPMMALQKIAVINGRPTLWGDGALGLVRGSGLCRYVKEWIDGTGDTRTAHCETQRVGEPEPQIRSFSIADAKKAGLWGKQGPWQQYPERMLSMRARAFNLRDTYTDVLGGMYLAEELQGTEPGIHAPATGEPPRAQLAPPPAPPSAPVQITASAEDRANDRAAERTMANGGAEPDQLADWLSERIEEAAIAGTPAILDEIDDQVCAELDTANRDDQRTRWNAAYSARKTTLSKKH